MLAVYGVLLLASAAMLTIWAYGQFRRAVPKRWTTRDSASNVVVLTIMALLAFGVGLIAKALLTLANNPIALTHVAMIAATLVAATLLGRVLRRSAALSMMVRPADAGATQIDVTPMTVAANDSGPGNGPRPVRGSRRRAA